MNYCEHCGEAYEPVRSTSKFCSDTCRVAHHRRKNYSVKKPAQSARENMRIIGRAMRNKDFQWEAAQELQILATMIKAHMPHDKTLWRCERCSKLYEGSCPGEGDCDCGEKAAWYIVPKLI